MLPIQIAFVENDAELRTELIPHYTRFFEHCGYHAKIFECGFDHDFKQLFESQEIHCVICDLGYSSDYSGLLLITNLRTNFPDILVIGTSRTEYSVGLVQRRQPSFQMFIDKRLLLANDKAYVEVIKRRFLKVFRVDTSLDIVNIAALKSSEFNKKLSLKRELQAIVRQIAFTDHNPDELLKPNEIELETLSGGFSGSSVFRIKARNKTSLIRSVPGVLKVSKIEFAIQELDNYQRFVKWAIPYSWRTDILGVGFSKTYGGIAYSFVLGDLRPFEPLTTLLRDKDHARIVNAIRRIFSPAMKSWYGESLIKTEGNIAERYSARYFRGINSKSTSEGVFMTVAQAKFGAKINRNRLEFNGELLDAPETILFGKPSGSFQSCICHGDLNSNNLLVADNDEIVFIDFQETGRGHVFEDFVTMESSIRLYYGGFPLSTGHEILESEKLIQNGDVEEAAGPGYSLISEIRKLAKQNFPTENFTNYYFATAAFCYRLLRAGISVTQKERVTGALIASIRSLSNSK